MGVEIDTRMFRLHASWMVNSIVYYEKLGAGYDIAARFSICNVFTVQHIFGTFVLTKGALNCNFLGSQSVKNTNFKKYASSNIFKLYIYL